MAGPISATTLLHWRRQLLRQGGRAADLDWLLDLAGGVSWRQQQRLRLEPEQPVALACSLQQLEALWRRHREQQEPLQYLVGRCPWRDLELSVAPGVLIPRQETELLVELALAQPLPPPAAGTPLQWADLGTGSGCLALALARGLPGSQGFAVDASPEALAVAARNLVPEALPPATGVQLLQGSWWEPLQPQWGQLQLVVSNPPYIPTEVWEQLEPVVREHEPALALNGGADGLEALRAIAAGAAGALAPGGWLLLEHHHDQSAAVMALLQQAGLKAVAAHQDLEGHHRFVSGQRSPR
jgi:release factor glutamine methyltransferase